MKKIIIILIGLFVATTVNAQQVSDYNSYINVIKEKNNTIKALKFTFESQKEGNKIGNTPADPTFEINPDFNGNIAFTAGVEFLFPTIYRQTQKLARISTQKNQYEYYIALYKELLLIDQSFLEAIYINKKLELLKNVYIANDKIEEYFTISLKEGAVSRLDLNTTSGELLRSSAAITEAELEYSNLLVRIRALNGGDDILVNSLQYPLFNIGSTNSYVERAMAKSFDIQITAADSLFAVQTIRLNKHAWAPDISLSYGYNVNPRDRATDVANVAITLSLPLWANSHKVRTANLQYSATMERNRQAQLDTETKLVILRNNFLMAQENYELHKHYFTHSSSILLLEKALKAGQISLIDYYSKINLIVEIQLKKFEYEYRVMTAMAEMQSLLY